MNKRLITRRFARAAESYEQEATVQRRVALKMTSLLETHIRPGHGRRILEIGCGTGLFSRMLLDRLKPERMTLNDLCPEMSERLKDLLNEHIHFEPGDAETYAFSGKYDLVASCSALQWFNAVEDFFARTCPLLLPDGILALGTFGGDNIKEITALTGKGLPYLSREELKNKLSSRYDVLYASEEKIHKTFNTPKEVLYHLKRTGVTGVEQQRWTKTDFLRFCNDYRTLYGNETEVTITYHHIYLIAKKRE